MVERVGAGKREDDADYRQVTVPRRNHSLADYGGKDQQEADVQHGGSGDAGHRREEHRHPSREP